MVSANRNEPLTPTFTVAISAPGLKPLDEEVAWDLMPWIGSVSVTDYVDRPAMFTLGLVSRDDEDGMTTWSEDERFKLGASVAVSFGYGSQVESLIAGEITALAPVFSVGSAPTLTVSGEDMRHRLATVPRLRKPYINLKCSEIAKFVCREAQVDIEVTESIEAKRVEQIKETDLALLQRCARAINYEIAMRGRTVLFRPVVTNKESVATLTLDDDLLAFQPSLALVAPTRIEVPGWDIVNKKPLIASRSHQGVPGMDGERSAAQEAFRVLGDCVASAPVADVASKEELESVADFLWDQVALKYVTGSGRCYGRTDIRAGTIITILGVGKRFNGKYYVHSATHVYTPDGGYETAFQIRRNAS